MIKIYWFWRNLRATPPNSRPKRRWIKGFKPKKRYSSSRRVLRLKKLQSLTELWVTTYNQELLLSTPWRVYSNLSDLVRAACTANNTLIVSFMAGIIRMINYLIEASYLVAQGHSLVRSEWIRTISSQVMVWCYRITI